MQSAQNNVSLEAQTEAATDPQPRVLLQLDEKDNPKNWSPARRWSILIVVSCFTLIAPMSSSMVAPALDPISEHLGIHSSFERQMVLSLFLLTYGLGPLLAGPLSETFGRLPVLRAGNVIYIVFNAAGGAAHTQTQMLIFRALAGFGAGAPLALGAAVISDLFRAEQRGTAVAIYNMAPLLGPSLGPIFAAVVTQYLAWPWIFYIMSIACGVLMMASAPLLRETYAPVLLHRKCRALEKAGGPIIGSHRPALAKILAVSLRRPLKMLLTQPAIQLLALYVAYLYGTMYLVLSTFPVLWVRVYHESVFIGGLNYICLGLGYFLGSQVCVLGMDRIFRRLIRRNGGIKKPEFKLPLAAVSIFLVPTGLFIYAWASQYEMFWAVPDLGALLFAAGVIIGLQCSTNYLIDTYPQYTASASGAVVVLRGMAGFTFPLFGPKLYGALGYGWGNSLLAFTALALGTMGPAVLWIFGERIRSHSKFCAGERDD